jgi:hypothetical protein
MFTPEGRVARVTYSQQPMNNIDNTTDKDELFDQAVVENVYLLVGRRDRIPAPDVKTADLTLDPAKAPKTPEDNDKQKEPINWLSGNSRWVVIGSLSGRVATIENANVDISTFAQTYTANPPGLTASSEQLRTQQIKNAREFTHEMKQVGGR